MDTIIDARGLSCPQPAVMCKNNIDKGLVEFKMLVDDPCAEGNVTRIAQNNNYSIDIKKQNDEVMEIILKKNN